MMFSKPFHCFTTGLKQFNRIGLYFLLVFVPLAEASRPNILLILADDVSPDLYGAYGLEGAAKTPHVDRLASQGVLFKTAYATAKCGSSRVEIMTGRYAHKTGVYTNDIWIGNAKRDVYSVNLAFSRALKAAGYATAITGKWHAGLQMPYEEVLGFDEYALWEGLKEIAALPGSPKFTGLMEDKKTPSRYWHPGYVKNGKLMATAPSDYGPDIEAEFIKAFMEKSVKAGKPFLAYWPTVAPHGSRIGVPTTPLRGKVGDLGLKHQKNMKHKDAENQARFIALNEYLDTKIGEVLAKIEALGIADNTVVFFVSDNGTAVTAKTRGVERGSHVVHIVAGAGIKQRGAVDELTDFSDIAPTLIDLAQAWPYVPANYNFDGKSLMPFLQGASDTHREWIYAYSAGSALLRTKNYLLEVVNPILDMPEGRFYYTAEHRYGRGYQLVDGNQEHAVARARFNTILKQFPPLDRRHSFFKTSRGARFLKNYESPESRAKHLYNHKDYKFYDETYLGEN